MTDARIVRTRAALRRAIAELAATKPVNQVTVSELAAAAGINRVTFYKHYTSPADTLLQVMDDALTEAQAKFFENLTNADDPHSSRIWKGIELLLDHVEENLVLYRTGFNDPADGTMREILTRHIHDTSLMYTKRFMSEDLDPALDPELISWYFAGGLTAAIRYWLTEDSFNRKNLRYNLNQLIPSWMRLEQVES